MVYFRSPNVFQRFWRYVSTQIRDMFVPTMCVDCHHNPTDLDRPICDECIRTLPRTEHGRVRLNGIESLFRGINEDYVGIRFLRGAAFGFYHVHEDFRELLITAKFFGTPQIDFQLGEVMAKEYLPYGFWKGIDAIVPIPLHPSRLQERGYNQSLYIARGIQEVTKIPIWEHALVRVKNNPKQSTLPFDSRHENVKGIFMVLWPDLIRDKTLLIVDDIITSGATITSALKTLFMVHGCKAVVASLAWAQK